MDLYSKELNMPIEYIEMKNKLKEYFAQEASRSSHNSHYSHSSTIEIQDSTVTAPLITTKSFDTLLLFLVIIIVIIRNNNTCQNGANPVANNLNITVIAGDL
ncbi:unnamed protein product [Rhizophagus irregularis]|nr:unnamed protein product [Rhizophagus irregularis]